MKCSNCGKKCGIVFNNNNYLSRCCRAKIIKTEKYPAKTRCRVLKCNNIRWRTHDLCRKHYNQKHNEGIRLTLKRYTNVPHDTSTVDKLMAYSDVTGDCRIWTRSTEFDTPLVTMNRKTRNARRVLYELVHDVVLSRKDFIFSTCNHPLCINPLHLYIGNANQLNPTHPWRKLTHEKVLDIKLDLALGVKHDVLAKQHGCSPSTIYSIAAGRTWRVT